MISLPISFQDLDYEFDSDDEWEDEPEDAEEIVDSDKEDAEDQDEADADDDEEGWMVPHGYLSDSEREGTGEDIESMKNKEKEFYKSLKEKTMVIRMLQLWWWKALLCSFSVILSTKFY